MMLARVADSLYWVGRYVERAEHVCRLADVTLNATLDRSTAANETARIALAALGDELTEADGNLFETARSLTLGHEDPNSVRMSLARARENARQVRDQITTEMWERLNMLYLRVTADTADRQFDRASSSFLHDVIADLHLFKGAADATMSHGEGWRFLMLGVHIERAQLIARLLRAAFGDGAVPTGDHVTLMNVLRMGCALEPYLRTYTAEIEPKHILDFLLFDEDFPRSIRFATARIEESMADIASHAAFGGRGRPERLAGRLRSRLEFTDLEELEANGAATLLASVVADCSRIHEALYQTFVAYPLEMRLPA
ncbi:MAG TPA: alpha-E domain-containing protein [Caulobacter sp.]|nr:alpha-E domain-containing protein [Caulobacter sp.]